MRQGDTAERLSRTGTNGDREDSAAISQNARLSDLEAKGNVETRLEQQVHHEGLHIGKYLAEDDQTDQESGDGKAVSPQPIEIFLGAGFVHEQHDRRAAVEWWNGEEIEGAKQEIHHEHGDERGEQKTVVPVRLTMEEIHGATGANCKCGQQHQRVVRCGASQSHPGGALGVAALPQRIVRSAGPANHAARKEKAENRHDDHAEGFSSDVRNRIESDLPTKGGGVVASPLGDKCVGGFMAGGRKKKDRIGDECDDKVLSIELIHTKVRLEF